MMDVEDQKNRIFIVVPPSDFYDIFTDFMLDCRIVFFDQILFIFEDK